MHYVGFIHSFNYCCFVYSCCNNPDSIFIRRSDTRTDRKFFTNKCNYSHPCVFYEKTLQKGVKKGSNLQCHALSTILKSIRIMKYWLVFTIAVTLSGSNCSSPRIQLVDCQHLLATISSRPSSMWQIYAPEESEFFRLEERRLVSRTGSRFEVVNVYRARKNEFFGDVRRAVEAVDISLRPRRP